MEFRTVIRPLNCQGFVNHDKPLLLLGSCFTDNIGSRLQDDLFDAEVNPFGPIYNPLSILNSLEFLSVGAVIEADELFERDNCYHSFFFHSRYSGSDPLETARAMTASVLAGRRALEQAGVVFLTLGTTRTFSLRSSGSTVANCHKLPSGEFQSRYLTLKETTEALSAAVKLIRRSNSGAKIIFTVSPLRYTEQGAHGNQLAKSTLLLAIDEVIRRWPDDGIGYFPAYEIMMDDLRDYRFYADDMKHPSSQAIDYIYEIFRASYFTPETDKIASEARALTRRLSHRILAASTDASLHEMEARKAAIEAFIEHNLKLTDACRRYNNTLFS